MQIGIEPLIYAAVFGGTFLLIQGIYFVAFGKTITLDRRVNRRLQMLEKGSNREEVLEQLRKEMSQHLNSQKIPLYSLLAEKAQKAAVPFSPQQLILLIIVAAIAAFVGLTIGTSAGLPLRIALSVLAGVGGVYTWVNGKAKKRLAAIEEQLPDAVDLMVRSLRVGHPFSSAIQMVAQEVEDPIATEFGIIADESTYGREVGDALKEMAERLDMQDMRFLAVAVTIQQQSGGNLAEILAGLSKVIRSRFRLFRRVKAITAEAQWSGKFLSAFPLVCLLVIMIFSPNYYDEVIDHPWFIPLCFFVGIMLTLNIIVMRVLTNIKV
ncbi:MAG: type II secretion system F family protein [Rhodobacteraceae bacterium]|nr:type II secretion system F family protein [Paracoccaceae bacterium]